MRRSCAILLFVALSHHVTCSLITDRVTKDIPIKDAEIEDNNVVVPLDPMVLPDGPAAPNAAASQTACAKVGQFCINNKDCCSNSCLGFKMRCVSGRVTED